MAQRVTQQIVQVAFETNPQARVTSIAAEVLQAPPAPAACVTSLALEVLQTASGTSLVVSGARPVVYMVAG